MAAGPAMMEISIYKDIQHFPLNSTVLVHIHEHIKVPTSMLQNGKITCLSKN